MQVENNHYENLSKDIKPNPEDSFNTKLDKCLASIAKNEGYISYNINKKAISADGGNYLGVLYEIDIKGKTAQGDKENAIFVKCMNPDAIELDVISLPNVYKTELFVYKELMKIYDELQEEANVPTAERFKVVKCYSESHDEALFFDNITKAGFKTWYRMDVATLEMAENCIKQLARFHGMSYVVKQKRPNYFNRRLKNIETGLIFGEGQRNFTEKYSTFALNFLSDDVRNKIEKKVKYMVTKMEKYHTGESEGFSLCHGDYRPNNIMVKEENGIVTEALPIDYQLIYYGCPINDFFYFMYTATNYKFRKAHLLHLKNLYYSSLEKFLQYFDICVESVLPRKIFENFYEERRDFGLIVTMLYLPFMYVSENDEVPDIATESLLDMELKVDDRYIERLEGAVEEMIDLDYF